MSILDLCHNAKNDTALIRTLMSKKFKLLNITKKLKNEDKEMLHVIPSYLQSEESQKIPNITAFFPTYPS